MQNKVLIIDFGSQYTHLIGRKIRELGIYAEIYPPKYLNNVTNILNHSVLILSGGPDSVLNKNSPSIDIPLHQIPIPILGICLGLQLLCRKSKESIKDTQGLNLIQGDVINLNDIKKIKKVPHMGWSTVTIKNNTILSQKNNNRDFYFAHSYAVELDDKKFELGTTTCHEYQISSIVTNNENVYGFQFHPEKSHQQGLNILKEFITNA